MRGDAQARPSKSMTLRSAQESRERRCPDRTSQSARRGDASTGERQPREEYSSRRSGHEPTSVM